jgi:hypothetical protein
MPERWRTRLKVCAFAVIILAMVTRPARAETSPIPAAVQLLLFGKIWMFDRSVAGNDHLVVAVLYQSSLRSSAEAKDQLIAAVRAGGLKIQCIPIALDDSEKLSSELQHVKADVFYVTEMRGINISDLVRISRARHIKTITVVEGYVEAGVAIGLRVRNDKPSIIVNLVAAKAEGSDLTAQLLRLSTIVDEQAGR